MSTTYHRAMAIMRNSNDTYLFLRAFFMYFCSPGVIKIEFKERCQGLHSACMRPLSSLLAGKYSTSELEKQAFVLEHFYHALRSVMNTMSCDPKPYTGNVRVVLLDDDELGMDTVAYILKGQTAHGLSFGMEFTQGDAVGIHAAFKLKNDDDHKRYDAFMQCLHKDGIEVDGGEHVASDEIQQIVMQHRQGRQEVSIPFN